MKLSESDWSALLGHLNATLEAFQVPQGEHDDVVAFVQSTKLDIIETGQACQAAQVTIGSLGHSSIYR